ncbi:UNVERIFIED_CONTAM: hypothetical protein GTU68_062806, partial [Idotea baltica]|nr:hypothetical protein [Idotea baltica]
TYSHPWETVTQAVWRKYPNPHKPEIVGTDVVERKVEKGVLHTTRLISSRWGLPDWAKKVIGTDNICYAFEDSKVDPIRQRMVMRTRNVTLASTVAMDEKMEYLPDPSDPSRTLLRQETLITVKGVPLTSYIESYLINSITSNSFKGREAMEWIIRKIDVEVEELMTSYKRGTSELKCSLEKIQDSAKKSIGGISHALKDIDDLSKLTQPNKPFPRI